MCWALQCSGVLAQDGEAGEADHEDGGDDLNPGLLAIATSWSGSPPEGPTRFSFEAVDWAGTKAWGEGA